MVLQNQGFILGLETLPNTPVSYVLRLKEEKLPLEVGNFIRLEFLHEKACIHCGRKVRKLYQSGYCFPCTQQLAECDLCIVKPHECHFHQGTCRDEQWAENHCMIPHYVYLAYSSGVKVGLTRRGRELTRWMEQGAEQAVIIAEVPNRKMAGELEMEIAQNIPDKTNWRKMLENHGNRVDLNAVRSDVLSSLSEKWSDFIITDPSQVREYEFTFPRELDFAPKLVSLSFDKVPTVEGTIRGIKGQYLLLDCGVLNIKKHSGYFVRVSVEN